MVSCGRGSLYLSASFPRKRSQVRHNLVQWPGAGTSSTPIQSSAMGLQDSEKHLEALELQRILLIPGSRYTLPSTSSPRPGSGQRHRVHSPHAPTPALVPTAGPAAAANRSGFPAGRAGWSSGWREKGKSLGGRRAGPAASGSRCGRAACSPPASLRLWRAVRGPEAGGCCHSSASTSDLASPCDPRLPGPCGPLATLPARGAAGRKGNAGTRTPAAARAHCTLAAARPRHRVSEPSVAPRQGPAPVRLRRCPGPAPPAARRSHPGTRDIPTTCSPWRNWSRPLRLQHAGRGR